MSGLAPVVPARMPLSMLTSAGMPAKALVVAVSETAVSSKRRIAIPPSSARTGTAWPRFGTARTIGSS
jgi:hypothetical protein